MNKQKKYLFFFFYPIIAFIFFCAMFSYVLNLTTDLAIITVITIIITISIFLYASYEQFK